MPSSSVKEKSAKSKKDSTSSKKSSKVVPPPKSTKSSERISQSDRDSETSSDETSSDDASDSEELPEKPTKAIKEPNGKKVAATESSDESGSGDESSSESSDEETSDAENATAIQPPKYINLHTHLLIQLLTLFTVVRQSQMATQSDSKLQHHSSLLQDSSSPRRVAMMLPLSFRTCSASQT